MMTNEWFAFGVGVAVKASVPLAIGAIVVFGAMRRRSAAERHMVWSLAVVGALLVPMLAVAVPVWSVSLAVPEWLAWSPGANASSDVLSSDDVTSSSDILASRDASTSGGGGSIVLSSALPVLAGRGTSVTGTRAISPDALVLFVWLFGALCMMARVALGFVRLQRVVRRATPLRDPALMVRARAIATDLGIDRPVRLLEGTHDAMPMTFGVARASLLLPSSAQEWTQSRQDAVLRHELAHVRRRDALTQLIAEIGCALYWFNPLMWVAARRLCVEREHACDDSVIIAGLRGSDYAAELLDIARSMQAQRATTLAAIAMARPSQLRTRLTAVLEQRRRSERVGVRLLVPAWIAAAAVVIPVSSGRLVARFGHAPDPKPVAERTWKTLDAPQVTVTPAVTTQDIPVAGVAGGEMSFESLNVALVAETPTAVPGGFEVADDAPGFALGGIAGGVATVTVRMPQIPRAAALMPSRQADCLTGDGTKKTNTSIHSNGDDERRTIKWSGDRCSGEAVIEGKVEFDADFTTITGLSRDGYLRLTTEENRVERRVVMRPGAGGLTYEYTVDGDRRTFDDAGRQWLANTLTFMFRRVGFMAKERAGAILTRGGPNALLTEVGVLSGDYVRATYLEVLIADGKLDEPMLLRVLDLAGRTIESDHYKTTIVTAVAGKYTFTDGIRTAYIDAIAGLDSDHYRHTAFTALLQKGNLTSGQVSAVLRESKRIQSDHYRAALLGDMAARYQMTPEIRAAYLEAASDIDSDHYKATVLTGLMKGSLSSADLARIADATATLDSDHYKAQVLGTYIGATQLTDATAQRAFIRAAAGIRSDHYLQSVLSSIVAKKVDATVLDVVLDAAAGVKGDHYRATLLTEIASGYKLEGATRDKFITLMDGMSSHYKGNVASLLLRTSR